MVMARENNNLLDNFGSQKDEKLALEELNIKKDYINLVSKSLNIGICDKNMGSRYTF